MGYQQSQRVFPTRSKAYADCRPSDFESFKQVPQPRDGLRLIIGRLTTADGGDIQDDFTVPIEKRLMGKPLDWILREVFCPQRGILSDRAKVNVKFMLEEAGARLGWLDTSLSPRELKLKDSDIVEVLVLHKAGGSEDKTLSEEEASLPSRQSAIDLFQATADELKSGKLQGDEWAPKVWQGILKYAEDDHVVLPGLAVLADVVDAKPSDRKLAISGGPGCDAIRLLFRILGELHSSNAAVQTAGWRLLAGLAEDPLLRPRLSYRGGAKTLALKMKRSKQMAPETEKLAESVLEKLGHKPADTTRAANSISTAMVAVAPAPVEDAAVKWQRHSSEVAVKLERAVHKADPMDIEKALLNLISKMRSQDVNWQGLQQAGVGRLISDLRSFEGDSEVQRLANKAVTEAGKLQIANFIR